MLSMIGISSEGLFESVSEMAMGVAEELGVGQNSHVVRGGTLQNIDNVMRIDC
jgi:hydroxymethylglutaryl-CoA lyase